MEGQESSRVALLPQTCGGSAERRVAPWGPGLVPGETKTSATARRKAAARSAQTKFAAVVVGLSLARRGGYSDQRVSVRTR